MKDLKQENESKAEAQAPTTGSKNTGVSTTTKQVGDKDAKASKKETKSDSEAPASNAESIPPRPIKKARTAYFIFADEKRRHFQSTHPGEGVGVVARLTGQAWAALSTEERFKYQELAATERAKVAKDLEDYRQKYGDVPDAKQSNTPNVDSLEMPVARIRKICKLDPEVKGISKEACMLITKCAELALVKLGKETTKVANIQNRRKLLPEDVAQVCSSREQFLFLQQDVKDLIKDQAEQQKLKQQQNSNKSNAPEHASGSKPLTAYFGAKT